MTAELAEAATTPLDSDRTEYGFTVGDRIVHARDASWTGVCVRIDRNLADASTCGVRWDDDLCGSVDGQFTNKLRRIP